jgi:hypothetical protein
MYSCTSCIGDIDDEQRLQLHENASVSGSVRLEYLLILSLVQPELCDRGF